MIEYRFQGDKVSQIQKIINEYDDIEKTTDMKMHRKKLVGYKLDVAEKEQAIDEKTINKMWDIIQNRCEERYDSGTYLEDKLDKIFEQLKAIQMYYPSGETYTITEEDYNDYFSV